ncbi:MAG: ATP-binding protein [Vicinamibacterales bacterium]
MAPSALATSTDRIGFSWLITARWVAVAAELAAAFVGRTALGMTPSPYAVGIIAGLSAAGNVYLAWRHRTGTPPDPIVPGLFVCVDVVGLSWLLGQAGGPLNPISIFLIVPIVLAALVLGRAWTWGITALAVAGYGVLFLVAPADLATRPELHSAIGRHIAGMWWAFAATATLVALLVARLASAVARRDRELAALRDQADRSARLAGLATLAAGAAHELSTPLGTVAVTARELEVALSRLDADTALLGDVALIRDELRRCRAILDDMSGRTGQPAGEMPTDTSLDVVIEDITRRLPAAERARVTTTVATHDPVTWPAGAVARAMTNLVRNGLQASSPESPVSLSVERVNGESVRLVVADQGTGMTLDVARRVGEPFFTTKPEGEGLGLGVFVARATVEHLGGTLEIDSTAGTGTRVSVVLPRRVSPRVEAATP